MNNGAFALLMLAMVVTAILGGGAGLLVMRWIESRPGRHELWRDHLGWWYATMYVPGMIVSFTIWMGLFYLVCVLAGWS